MKEIRVGILKNWDAPNLMRQTPLGEGKWGRFVFTEDLSTDLDYLVVLNFICKNVEVNCSSKNIFGVLQEPYKPLALPWVKYGHKPFRKYFTHTNPNEHSRYKRSHPMLPWWVDKSYDELKKEFGTIKKEKNLSWITSKKVFYEGHRKRLAFLDCVESSGLDIDLFGKGIKFIDDKYNGLAPYKYSIAVENSKSDYYWSEKIMDCFLSETLPFYYGDENLEHYFPKESFIRINIENPGEALEIINNAIFSKQWENRREAILEAKDLILNKYQFFPSICKEIEDDININGFNCLEEMSLKAFKAPFYARVINKAKRIVKKV